MIALLQTINNNMCSALLCGTSHSAESLINAVEESQPDASLVIQILHVLYMCLVRKHAYGKLLEHKVPILSDNSPKNGPHCS